MKLWAALFFCLGLFAIDRFDRRFAADKVSMTGDWNGYRTRASEAGLLLSATYANDLVGNPVGGKSHGFANAGSFGIDLLMDWEKVFGLKDALLFSSFIVRHGNNLSREKIGNQFPVQQLFGGETYMLCELYLQKGVWDQRIVAKAGRLAGGNDFLASPIYGKFVNNAFCGNPISIFFNTLFTAYPFATWGAYVSVKPDPSLFLQFACYNNNKNVFKDKYHGTYFAFKSTQGVTFITEWAYLANAWGLPGNYKAGVYYVTGRVPQFTGGSQVGNYGYYFLFDQMIYQNKAQQITPFIALLLATPQNRNKFPFFTTAGVVYQGIIPKRDMDNLTLGVAYGSYSTDIEPRETYECILELNYWYWINQWFVVAPDLQYIINPKGYNTIPNAFVVGMQVLINI